MKNLAIQNKKGNICLKEEQHLIRYGAQNCTTTINVFKLEDDN